MREQFYGIIYSYVVLLNFTVYVTVLCHMFLLNFTTNNEKFWYQEY